MISVVIYGRNDNYGYNLHKRAAISFNCIAEILDDPADELLFVDYNSPDDGPTFPEAIADTLTPAAKRRLRILRARPRLHERFRRRTRLEAIEPVARNIAVRRSNPANRWILSTNSDIIVVPRRKASLSEVAAVLPRGLYHVPRFELPESLWESFDRFAPQQTIADVRDLGVSARLNEVVQSEVILYDGPGDFQLIERADLFAIDGFDEEMILGWHVDSNLAARLILKHGRVSPLLDEVFCYHCDHTRRATIAHSGVAIENDWQRFVAGVTRPDVPEQRDRWGCADAEIEEIRLADGATHGYRAVLQAAVAPLDQDFTQVSLTRDTFDGYDYEPAHVVPFLADLLNSYPRDTTLGWCGVRADMFELFVHTWRLAGFSRPITLDAASAERGLGAAAGPVRIAGRAEWMRDCDLLVFEFGRADAGGSPAAPLDPEAAAVLQSMRSAFLDAVAAERARLAEDLPPRRFIGINCIHNRMEGLFAAHVGITRTPFSSHLRHGFLLRRANSGPAEGDVLALLIGEALGHGGPIGQQELALARYLFTPLLETGEISPELRPQITANAALGRAFLEAAGRPRRPGPRPAATERALAALAAIASDASAELGVVVVDGRFPVEDRPVSRFPAEEDWDDPNWSRFLAKPADPLIAPRRDFAQWEQAQLLYGLDRLWRLTPSSRLLAVVTMPDPTVAALAERAGAIDLLDLRGAGSAETVEDAWRRLSGGSPRSAHAWCRIEIVDPAIGLSGLPAALYDAIVFPHGAAFANGRLGAFDLLEAAARLLRPDGVLVFKAEIAAGEEAHANFFDAGVLAADGLGARLAEATGLELEDGFDARLSRATLSKVWPESGPAPGGVYFLTRHQGRIVIPSLWFLRKRRDAPPGGWQRLRRWLVHRHMGEQIGRLRIGVCGERQERSIAVLTARSGHVFFGPYIPVVSGRYRLAVRFAGWDGAPAPGLRLEAVAGPTVFASQAVDEANLAEGAFEMLFTVPPGDDGRAPPADLEIRAFSPGSAVLRFTSVAVWPLADEPEDAAAETAEEPAEAEETAAEAAAEAEEAPPEDAPAPEPQEATPCRPLSRFAGEADWDDAAWACFADADEAHDRRSWERTHLLFGLDQAGLLTPAARVAIVAKEPDPVIGALSQRVGRVDILDISGEHPRSAAEARLHWTDGALYARDRLHILEVAGVAGLPPQGYDAVIFPHGSLFAAGVAGAAATLAAAEAAVGEAGLIAFAAEIVAGAEADPDFFDEGLTREDGFAARLADTTGLVVEGGFDGSAPPGLPLARQDGDRLLLPSLWFLRKRGATPPAAWQQLATWLGERLLGDQLPRLLVGPAGRRQPEQASIETLPGRRGHVFFGPYLPLPEGAYEATFGFDAGGPRGSVFVFDVVAGGQELAKRRIAIDETGRRHLSLPFEIRPGPARKIEIRASSDGGEAVIFECRLDRRAAG